MRKLRLSADLLQRGKGFQQKDGDSLQQAEKDQPTHQHQQAAGGQLNRSEMSLDKPESAYQVVEQQRRENEGYAKAGGIK
jgi:hypothetical protein